jgi:hypothetical protein
VATRTSATPARVPFGTSFAFDARLFDAQLFDAR